MLDVLARLQQASPFVATTFRCGLWNVRMRSGELNEKGWTCVIPHRCHLHIALFPHAGLATHIASRT